MNPLSQSSTCHVAGWMQQAPLTPPLAFAYSLPRRRRRETTMTTPLLWNGEKSHLPTRLSISAAATATSSTTRGRRQKRPLQASLPRSPCGTPLYSSEYDDDSKYFDDYEEESDDIISSMVGHDALGSSKIETLEDLLMDLEHDLETLLDGEDDDDDDLELDEADFDNASDVNDLLSLLGEESSSILDDNDDGTDEIAFSSDLEKALLKGVVPVSADVGSECLPGDWGFDPFNFAEKDWILQTQYTLLQAMPGVEKEEPPPPRPSGLILRDYREAEIRHGRLAMLAAVFWPLQEMLDRFLLDADQFGPLIYGPVTLPYFPLLMTLMMMLLGYLDVYAKAIQEKDDIGDAFLPGDCFWDPLKMLEGAPATMERNMQERELFNGRVAMLAVAAYTFEEVTTRLPVIEVKGNELLFLPAYQVPYIQEYLDQQFSFYNY